MIIYLLAWAYTLIAIAVFTQAIHRLEPGLGGAIVIAFAGMLWPLFLLTVFFT